MKNKYNYQFHDVKEVWVEDIQKNRLGKVSQVTLHIDSTKGTQDFELTLLEPDKPIEGSGFKGNPMEWDELGTKFNKVKASSANISKKEEDAFYFIDIWQQPKVLALIRCNDIQGLP